MRLISLALFALIWAGNASAQTIVVSGDKVQWDQEAASLESANTFEYLLMVDGGTENQTLFPLAGAACVKLVSATVFQCSAPLPALSKGEHTLEMEAVRIKSGLSKPLAIVVPESDPRCAFPSGSAAVTIFPTRLLSAGSRSALSFQLGGSAFPIVQISVILTPDGTGEGEIVSKVTGNDVTNVGTLWFDRPVDPGTYNVSIRAANSIGCSRTSSTIYQVLVQ